MSEWSDKMSGQAKETAGKMTDNMGQEMEGKALKARGEAKDKINDTKRSFNSDEDKELV